MLWLGYAVRSGTLVSYRDQNCSEAYEELKESTYSNPNLY